MAERSFNWRKQEVDLREPNLFGESLLARYRGVDVVLGNQAWRRLVESVARRVILPQKDRGVSLDLPPRAVELLNEVFDAFLSEIHGEDIAGSRSTVVQRRLFISHRQCDSGLGERVACIAQEHQFAYWLDVHDPFLNALTAPGIHLPPQVVAVLTAAVIEIALLNCSHVVALLSQNAAGSLWIPYELGRAKKSNTVWSLEASSWVSPMVQPPEYVHLAPVHRRESDLRRWLGGTANQSPCRAATRAHHLDQA